MLLWKGAGRPADPDPASAENWTQAQQRTPTACYDSGPGVHRHRLRTVCYPWRETGMAKTERMEMSSIS